MAKSFAPRTAKKQRDTIDLSERLSVGKELFKSSDEKLLQGARLDDIPLKNITVRDQVRTKFNDDSIRELARNIQANGLIQPLVIHREGDKFVLICGERRFRAMTSVNMEKCPCFILENKTQEELMAIQFSENSAREALHYIDKADGILNYQRATDASERKITDALGISKSEVHRSLMIAKMPKKIKEAAKVHNIEKYVLLEFDALEASPFRSKLEEQILQGEVTKRSQLKRALNKGSVKVAQKTARKRPALPAGLSANAFLKAMEQKTKNMELDSSTQKAIKALMDGAKEIVDL
jgi:ParB family chromosome partitioning protein